MDNKIKKQLYTSNINSANMSNRIYNGPYINLEPDKKIEPVYTEVIDFSPFKKIITHINYKEATSNIFDSEKSQGLTYTDNYIYITAHDPNDDLGSRIYVYDKYTNEYIGYIRLADFNNKDKINEEHVGGITYDKEHNIIFITQGNGEIIAYDNSYFEAYIEKTLEKKENENKINFSDTDIKTINGFANVVFNMSKEIIDSVHDFNYESRNYKNCIIDLRASKEKYEKIIHISKDNGKDLDVTKGNKNAATVYYHDGILYSSTFEALDKGEIKAFKVIYDPETKKINYEKLFETSSPMQTQGIAVTEYNGKKYLLTSQSLWGYSYITTSIINDDNTVKTLGRHKIRGYGGMQGISINENNDVVCISEFKNHSKKLSMNYLTTNYDICSSLESNIQQYVTGYLYEYGPDILNEIKENANTINPINTFTVTNDLIKDELDDLDRTRRNLPKKKKPTFSLSLKSLINRFKDL